ncbi:uncharacterized protein LOC132695972 [Cylas formicarius]|uniref:uncharacterized protein LOC132695972 n=1 Tax=Cylas formicarius TaxID=197179 RepID=UPI002958394A|nr:uncharacterized protein LOC132695972 [Cylas formicarius]XP_060516485.1 uncharacterized protein LOC132695972 [Cylas formicarius]XP_060516489.1 uncharacterized protein LOC132695972 [Cylas formicarius]XP_060516497.1 uncharacterized protein LOC132695972 [Cylas formicarius]XP_060516501.1 uncharacterized protein LOC132695972 [Cylas formicarius]XP_060516510.1 uncharacterized protein LOC132695972 [Cylas formicarius]
MESTTDLVTQSVDNIAERKTFRQMTMKERSLYIREVITVEPIIAAYVMAALLVKPALLVLEFEKACKANLGFNDTVCNTIVNSEQDVYPEVNVAIQERIGIVHSWQYPIQSVMPLILVLFLGSYSDRHQLRKPFLVLPLLGELFAVAGCILSVIFMKSWTLEVLGVVQTVIPSFFGGQTMIVMAVFAYIADVSTLEMRTLRIGVVQIVLNACAPLVQSFSAVLFVQVGYVGILIIAGALYLFGAVYGLFWIDEPKRPLKDPKKSLFADIFNTKHAADTFSLIFKKSLGNDRFFIVVLLITMLLYTVVNVGEDSVFWLYTQGYLGWNVVDYTFFLTVNTLIHLVGTILAVPLFTKIFELSDSIIIVLTLMDKVLCNIILGLAKTKALMYVGAAVSLITGVTAIGIRSLATKVVSVNDLGKAQSLFGIAEAIGPAVATPLYNKGIYLNTFDVLPSAFFFFGILLYVFCMVLLSGMYFRQKRRSKESVNGVNGTAEIEKPVQMDDFQVTHM